MSAKRCGIHQDTQQSHAVQPTTRINMCRMILLLLVAIPFSFFSQSALCADEDSVLIEFDRARSSAESDRMKFRASAEKWFESRENESRRRGNKDSVDALGRLRGVFNKHEILPPNAPKDLQKQQQSYREKMRSTRCMLPQLPSPEYHLLTLNCKHR